MNTYELLKGAPGTAGLFIREKKTIQVIYNKSGIDGIRVRLRCTHNNGRNFFTPFNGAWAGLWDIDASFSEVQEAQDFVDRMIAEARVNVAKDIERLKAHGYY